MPNVRLRPSGHLTLQVCLLVSFISVLTLADEVRCFCDRLSCPGTSVCTGKWCLVGISTEGGTGHLEQICGWDERDRPLDCEKNWDRWAEVCACDEPPL
ncbi:hypothetical protein M3Y97_00942000 [Aphelenchoides bicaudatus]|nr:hypothetical protein M3Y97_00942000 [Aphelenchoides bicaudatus]